MFAQRITFIKNLLNIQKIYGKITGEGAVYRHTLPIHNKRGQKYGIQKSSDISNCFFANKICKKIFETKFNEKRIFPNSRKTKII